MISSDERKEFFDYCASFYCVGGIYYADIKASHAELKAAIDERIKMESPPFEGDTIDREMVREIILQKRHPDAKQLNGKELVSAIFDPFGKVSTLN